MPKERSDSRRMPVGAIPGDVDHMEISRKGSSDRGVELHCASRRAKGIHHASD